MNRKKIFAVIITVAAVINSTACQSKEEKYHIKTKDAAYYDMSYNVYENGLLYTVPNASGTQACFLDYETMNGVPFATNPIVRTPILHVCQTYVQVLLWYL